MDSHGTLLHPTTGARSSDCPPQEKSQYQDPRIPKGDLFENFFGNVQVFFGKKKVLHPKMSISHIP